MAAGTTSFWQSLAYIFPSNRTLFPYLAEIKILEKDPFLPYNKPVGRSRRKKTPGKTSHTVEHNIDWNKAKIVMLVGLPGSGKSTWAKKMRERYSCVVVSADDIRLELFSDLEKANSLGRSAHALVFKEAHLRIRSALQEERVVIADATHLYSHAREPLFEIAKNERVPLEIVFFDNEKTALGRNSAREDATRVPGDAMERMCKVSRKTRAALPEKTHIIE